MLASFKEWAYKKN